MRPRIQQEWSAIEARTLVPTPQPLDRLSRGLQACVVGGSGHSPEKGLPSVAAARQATPCQLEPAYFVDTLHRSLAASSPPDLARVRGKRLTALNITASSATLRQSLAWLAWCRNRFAPFGVAKVQLRLAPLCAAWPACKPR
jgi:hypothetical protein